VSTKNSDLDDLIEEITVDAHGDDEQLSAISEAFDDQGELPCDAHVIGEPVSLVQVDYDGNERRGLTARCCREDGSSHVVALCDVVLPHRAPAARLVAAYRRWMGLEPWPAVEPARRRAPKATAADLDLDGPIELIALSVKERGARCRLPGSERIVTLRATGLWDVHPGELVRVAPRKQWSYAGHPYLSGEIESRRIDARALGLVPLRLQARGTWDPAEQDWGEPIADWAQPIVARGTRTVFELEEVPPSSPDSIREAAGLRQAGDREGATRLLMQLCEADLRCLAAHAYLGALAFADRAGQALGHFEVGLRIGELSLPEGFDGLLPWDLPANRHFLSCLHGYGLGLWRQGRLEQAERVLERILWLNPGDDQGARFQLRLVRGRTSWEEAEKLA
jgi:tetratricopeptide (TPR) repeat protein